MSRSLLVYALLRAAVLTLISVCLLTVVDGQVMSGGSYSIQSDSINIGGGFGSSTSYVLESTAGELATGNSTSTNYVLRSGYQQMQEVYISISDITDTTLSPAINGLTGGVASGTVSFTVITDSPSGYAVNISGQNTPAMQSSVGTIANYVPIGLDPDYTFVVASNEARFGFTVEGGDITNRFKDSGGLCNVIGGNNTIDTCYVALGTTSQTIASGLSSNHPLGATTTLRFKVGVGGTSGVIAGEYVATSTVTVLPL